MTRDDLIYRIGKVLKVLSPSDASGHCPECGHKVKVRAIIDLPASESLVDELERDGLQISKAS